ncbi:MAG TPA: hypothetical protein VF751_12675 [Chthoniobacterales bacterium]
MQRHLRSAALAFFFTLPALALCLSSLLKFHVPLPLIHPALVIGGLLAALVLSLVPIAGVHARLEDGALISDLAIKLKGSLPNLGVALLSLGLLGLIALYLFVENFQPR